VLDLKRKYNFYQFVGAILLLILLNTNPLFSQKQSLIYGYISDSIRAPLKMVSITAIGTQFYALSSDKGYFELKLPSGSAYTLAFSYVGYKTVKVPLGILTDEKKGISISMESSSRTFDTLTITAIHDRGGGIIRLDPKTITSIPSANGGVEALIKTIGMGVTSNNELSSQYNVRGGNYDENLVYVNDIEVYRPFLVRSGQQEGLSFINPDLVQSISFSAGGFDAKYGDKLSSVLDIQYKKPTAFAASTHLSMLGAAAHVEGTSENYRFTYLVGVRQKSNQYVLHSLETKGDYKPSFTDIQALLTFAASEKLEISVFGNYARNVYKVVPQNRETDFGTLNDAKRLTIYFDGQEVDQFKTFFGAASASFKPNKNTILKFIAAGFNSKEKETYDIQGQYWLNQLESDMGQDDFGQVSFNLGVGTFLNHARNSLNSNVFSIEHKGVYSGKKNYFQWGTKYQHEYISDQIREWKMIDSAGYTLPYYPTEIFNLQDVVMSKNSLNSNRINGFIQNIWSLDRDSTKMSLTAGIRYNYWDFNEQLLISPRATFTLKPKLSKDIVFRFSTGYYYQPPFYRELRDMNGVINRTIKAQKSIHFVLGSDWNLKAWGRPFRYVTEVYYKYMNDLIPYEVDNVRIRYYATNSSHGYATGIDIKINGEFVKGIESWAGLSVMQTREDIEGDYYYTYYNKDNELIIPGYTMDNIAVDSIRHEPGYIPRPTDQRVNFSLFFQDYLPKFPTYKMHLNLVFGSALPFGPPSFNKYKDTLRMPPYRRVDIGFSKQIKGIDSRVNERSPFKYFKTIWVSLEVFNLLQVNNTISYLWIKDVTNRTYAVPNFLTRRQLNLKIVAEF